MPFNLICLLKEDFKFLLKNIRKSLKNVSQRIYLQHIPHTNKSPDNHEKNIEPIIFHKGTEMLLVKFYQKIQHITTHNSAISETQKLACLESHESSFLLILPKLLPNISNIFKNSFSLHNCRFDPAAQSIKQYQDGL